tara:strand:- start:334 stop:606 length:273 start_codon:yes stop_codon:yes gene_type:complete
MKLWPSKKQPVRVPQSYNPQLNPAEVIDFYSRLTLHHQAALLRLISRNLVIKNDDQVLMGYDFGFDVDGAVICMYPETDLDEVAEIEPSA